MERSELAEFWAEVDSASASQRRPLPVRFGNEAQNYYFVVTRMPAALQDCPRYLVQRYTPASTESVQREREIARTEHDYRFLTNFNLLVNRLLREGYAYKLL